MSQREYLFINDPDHKENLSGRVKAACHNCRRKKVKCSGTVPCSVCEQKGRICEGIGPLDGEDNGPAHDSSSTVPARITELGGVKAHGKRSIVKLPSKPQLKTSGSGESNDSGYASTSQQYPQSDRSPPAKRAFNKVSTQDAQRSYNFEALSPVSAVSDRAYEASSGMFAHATDPVSGNRRSRIEQSLSNDGSYQVPNADASTMIWQPDVFLPDAMNTEVSSLVTAADQLEEQARALRRLANQRQITLDTSTSNEKYTDDWLQSGSSRGHQLPPMDTSAGNWLPHPETQADIYQTYSPEMYIFGSAPGFETNAQASYIPPYMTPDTVPFASPPSPKSADAPTDLNTLPAGFQLSIPVGRLMSARRRQSGNEAHSVDQTRNTRSSLDGL